MPSLSFDRIADRYDATRGGLRRGRSIAAGLAPWIVGPRVVEIGIGTGAVALGLREQRHHVVGVDLSPAMLGRAVERLGPPVGVAVADGYALPFRDGAADTVYLVWVLQLVPDRFGFMAAAARLVAPGGRLIVVPSHQESVKDDVEAIAGPLHGLLRPERQDAAQVEGFAPALGLRHVATSWTPEDVYDRSPNAEAQRLEEWTYSAMWMLTDADYERLVAPVVAALRALPDPDRPRTKRSRCAVVVLERPA